MSDNQHSDLMGNEIVRAILSSVTSLEIMSLFNTNPNLIDTTEGVAKRLGLGPEKIESDLNKLVSTGLLKKRTASKSPVFMLDKAKAKEADRQIQAALDNTETKRKEKEQGKK